MNAFLTAYFGLEDLGGRSRWSPALAFFKSPVVFALVIGLLWGILGLPGKENPFVAPIFSVCWPLR